MRICVRHRTPPAREVSRCCWVERSRKRFFHSGSPLAAAAVLGFLTRALRIRHPNSWQIFWKKPKTKRHTTAGKRNPQRSPRYRATSGSGGQGNGGAFSFVRGFLPRTERAAPAGCTTPRSRNALDSLEALDAVTQSVARYDGGQGERGSAPRQREGAGRRPIVDEGHREFYAAGHRGRGVLAAARARRHAPTQPQRR